jgi:pimeloyl-ACP methyl ester carboxylesterase
MKRFHEFREEQMAYQDKGKGRVIVLIHGFLANGNLWKAFSSRLAKDYRLIIPDLAGHGDSNAMGYVHSMELLAESIQSLLQELKIRKAIFVGHSLGAYVALAFAEKTPDSVLGLLLINSTAKGDSAVRKRSRNQLIHLVKEDRDKAIKLLLPTFFKNKKRKTHYHIRAYSKMAEKCELQGILATIEGMKRRKEREIVLKFAPFPFAYFVGGADEILPYKVLQAEAQLGENGSFAMIGESGHILPIEHAEFTYRAIKLFAKELSLKAY